MSDNTLNVSIVGKDQLSPVFQKVASSAKQAASALKDVGNQSSGGLDKTASSAKRAGAAVEDMGQDANRAASQMDKAGSAATKLGSNLDKASSGADKFRSSMTAAGAAMGAAVAGLSKVGQAAQTQQRQVAGIGRAYGDMADQILDFTRQISSMGTTIFSQEDAREAALIASTLTREYGLTVDQVEQLITASADLASIYGVTLADAVQRTSAAIRGEAESAEFLGLTLNQQAIDRENLTLSMSNQEAAQFRLNALLEQSAYATGAAGDAANTAAGKIQSFFNGMQDAAAGVGAFIGPIGAAAAPMAEFALLLPVAGAAIADLAGGMRLAGAAAGVLAFATNPVVIALTALAGLGAIVVKAHMDAAQAAEDHAQSYRDLETAIAGVDNALARSRFAQAGVEVEELAEQNAKLEEQLLSVQAVQEQANKPGSMNPLGEAVLAYEDYTLSVEEATKVNQELIEMTEVAGDRTSELAVFAQNLSEAYNNLTLDGTLWADALSNTNDILGMTGEGAEKLKTILDGVIKAEQQGTITTAEAAERINILADNRERYVQMLERNEQSIHDYAQAEQEAAAAMGESAKAAELSRTQFNALAQDRIAAREAAEAEAESTIRMTQAAADMEQGLKEAAVQRQLEISQLGEATGASGRYADTLQQVGEAAYTTARQTESHADSLQAAQEAIAQYEQAARQLVNTLKEAGGVNVLETDENGILQLSGSIEDLATAYDLAGQGAAELFNTLYDAPFLDVAADIETTGAALDGIIAQFEQLDALGARSAAAGTIAENLIGPAGELGTIDTLLNENRISLEQYNEAVRAGTQIAQLDYEVQQDLNTIRADRLTQLANEEAAYAVAIDALANMTSAEQQLALSMLDTTTQAEVAAAQSALYSAALGDIPAEAATEVVLDIANASDDAAAFLEQVGVIEKLPDGSWAMAIDISGGDEAKATIDTLQETVQDLQSTQIDIFLASTGDEEALARLQETRQELDGLDGKQATVSITSDRVTETKEEVEGVAQAVREADGTSARVSINEQGSQEAEASIQGAVDAAHEADGTTATITIETNYAEPGGGPMSSEDITGTQAPALIPVEAHVMEFDTSLIDSYEPPKITVDAAVEVDRSELDSLTGASGGGAAVNPSITIDAKVEVDTSEIDALTGSSGAQDGGGSAQMATIDMRVDVDTSELNNLRTLDPIVVPAKIDLDTSSASSARGALAGEDIVIQARVEVDDSSLDQLGLGRLPVSIKAVVEVDDSSLDQLGMGRLPISIKATVEVDDSDLANIDDGALAAFDGKTYTAVLEATNNSSETVSAASNAAANFANDTYNASLTATDSASGTISTAQGAATTFATTYTASLAASDGASSVISGAKALADGLNTTFTASLAASDGASGTISSVSGQLDALNGKTATVYINVSQSGPIPAMAHGGIVGPDIPHAANGRNIIVGEHGPEMALLPFGTMVQPHGASMSRMGSEAAIGSSMVNQFVGQLNAGEGPAREGGEQLVAATIQGMESGMAAFPDIDPVLGRKGWTKRTKLRRPATPEFPEGPPKALPEDATEQQEKAHEKATKRYENQYGAAMGALENRIDIAREQMEGATNPQQFRAAVEILDRLEYKKIELERAERRREAAAEKAERAAERAEKASESATEASTEGANEASEATEGWQQKIQDVGQAWKGTTQSVNQTSILRQALTPVRLYRKA